MICRATRPSWVSTKRPTESISSRPQGARPRSWGGEKRLRLGSSRQWVRGLISATAGVWPSSAWPLT